MEETYYIGTDLKFAITITAEGFSQANDYWTVELYSGKTKLTATSNGIGNTPGVEIVHSDDEFFLLVETSKLRPGTIRMVVTAYVPDEDFPGNEFQEGTRREVAVQDIANISSIR